MLFLLALPLTYIALWNALRHLFIFIQDFSPRMMPEKSNCLN